MGLERLGGRQRALLEEWLPGLTVEADHSWGLVETTVLAVTHAGDRLVVKAGGPSDHHLEREIRAHLHWLGPWTGTGHAARLLRHDTDAKLLVREHLPGCLVQGTDHADDPDTYRQAGRLLARMHAQHSRTDDGFEAAETRKALAWLDGPHRIPAGTEQRLRREIAAWPAPPVTVVPTHGDWQPRNWLVHDGVVRVIDLGRAAMRPAASDLARLAAQDFRRDPALEAAFLDGYGADPREPEAWRRTRVREAVGTAAWAFRVGDEAFEAQGHRMVAEALADRAS